MCNKMCFCKMYSHTVLWELLQNFTCAPTKMCSCKQFVQSGMYHNTNGGFCIWGRIPHLRQKIVYRNTGEVFKFEKF